MKSVKVMKLLVPIVIGSLLASRVSAYPTYWGDEEGDCGELPDEGYGNHKNPIEDTKSMVMLMSGTKAIDPPCFYPGQSHVIHVEYPNPRLAWIEMSSGNMTTTQGKAKNGDKPDGLCDNRRRNIGYSDKNANPIKVVKLDWTAPKETKPLTMWMTSADGEKSTYYTYELNVNACKGKVPTAVKTVTKVVDPPAVAPAGGEASSASSLIISTMAMVASSILAAFMS